MDISKLVSGVKIKSKGALIGIDPTAGKGPIDAALILDKALTKDNIITEGEPVIMNGPGEYEIRGVKLSGIEKDNAFVYSARIDSMKVCIMKASSLPKAKDILEECEIVIANADTTSDQKLLVGLNPNVVIFYGEHAQESAKAFGKDAPAVTKYTVTRDKLPSEMEIVVLG